MLYPVLSSAGIQPLPFLKFKEIEVHVVMYSIEKLMFKFQLFVSNKNFVILFIVQHGNIEFSGQSVSPVHMGSAVFTTVKSVQSQVGNPIRVPTHYQPNNKARPGAIRYSGRPFTSHHLQPILPRPAIESKFTPPQNFNKQPEKPLEPKVRRYSTKYHVVSLYIENLIITF